MASLANALVCGHTMLSLAIPTLSISLLSLWHAICRACDGFEDEYGFHPVRIHGLNS